MSPPPRLFGTDGIRGVAGEPPLDAPTVAAVGRALGTMLAARAGGPPVVLLAGDTRPSTPEIARWLTAGLEAAGAGARWAGVLPTPAVALLVQQMGLDAGIAVSASHNPAADNGIKLFDRRGRKWSPERESALEARVAEQPSVAPAEGELPLREATAANQYLDYLVGTLPAADTLAGLRIVVDGAHGAATPLLAELTGRLRLDAILLHATPDGTRINSGCGSTHPRVVAEATAREGAELGFTLDGDADRVLLADTSGRIRDGDTLLYLWARDLQRRGRLEPPRIVATTMSNLGLERSLARHGIDVVRCDVGDREVAMALEWEGLLLGGEQSGHLLHRALSTTGDGLLTALQIAAIVRRSEASLADLLADFQVFPQVLRNVRVPARVPFSELPAVQATQRQIEAELDGQGRLLLRYSGTEPLARIMIEGPKQDAIEQMADRLAAAIEEALGASLVAGGR
ncbi:MAG: phosphoglucosamine mutase [Thermoanaerobaculia bacterium]